MSEAEGLRRRCVQKEELNAESKSPVYDSSSDPNNDNEDYGDKEMRLTLMEEVLLVGLKDQDGYTSFWNDKISSGLRGCILIELAFRDRIALDGPLQYGANRPVVVKSTASTGDQLLDEALRIISDSLKNNYSVSKVIEYLSGESWNLFMMSSQMRNVRERVAKSLVEKGILTTEKVNYVIVDFTTHPLVKYDAKRDLVKKLHDALVFHWPNDHNRLSKHILALILLCNFSDVLEDSFSVFSESDYQSATKNLDHLLALNFSQLASDNSKYAVMWAVFHALAKQ